MELNTASILSQSNITGPAFLVKDGIIVEANPAAIQHQFTAGVSIESVILIGLEDYRSYKSGKLYLQLGFGEYSFGAYITKVQDLHLFCLESDYEDNSLRLMALLSQHLREPLGSAMLNTELLQQDSALMSNPALKKQLGQINRALHQLTRTVCNMSDAADCRTTLSHMETQDIVAVLDEFFPEVAQRVRESGRELCVSTLRKSVVCPIDTDLLKRAVLNLVANSIRFSPEGSAISIKLQHSNHTLRITIENHSLANNAPLMPDPFRRFLREPGIEESRYGVGLGMTLVRQAAIKHGGTLLFDSSKKDNVKVIMTIDTDRKEQPILRSPLQVVGGYAGGLDTLLIELSDVLPDSAYESF